MMRQAQANDEREQRETLRVSETRRVWPQHQPHDERDEQRVERVHLGGDGLMPERGRDGEGERGEESG